MVQILPANRPKGFAESIMNGIADSAPQAIQQYQQMQQQKRQMMQENAAAKRMGIDLAGIQDPKTRQLILSERLKGQEQRNLQGQKLQGEQEIEGRDYNVVKNTFGEKFADLWRSQSPDARNALIRAGIESSQRGMNIEDMLGDFNKDNNQSFNQENDLYKDLTPKERAKKKGEIEKLHRGEQTELSKPVLLEMNQVRKNIPLQEQAILDIKEAAPNVSALDYFADITGFEPLRTAQGAKLKTGIKDFFLSDLTRVGARPNQWIEQQLADALPKIGRSPEANLITAEGLQFKLDLSKKRMETIDKLAEKDRNKFGYVKGDIDSRAYDEMKKYVIDRQKELSENIKKIKKDYKGIQNKVKVRSPEGITYEIDSNDLDEALENEYTIAQ